MSNSKKIVWYNLAFMAFSTVWGFGNVVNGFVYFNGVQVIFLLEQLRGLRQSVPGTRHQTGRHDEVTGAFRRGADVVGILAQFVEVIGCLLRALRIEFLKLLYHQIGRASCRERV